MIALENELIKDFVKIFVKKEQVSVNEEYHNFIKYLKPPILIGDFQVPDKRLLKQSGNKWIRTTKALNEKDLAKKTKLKIILSKNKSNYPYVNINGDVFEANFTATYNSNSNTSISRQKIVDHIKSLIAEGDKIEIYDKYLFCDNESEDTDNSHYSVRIMQQFINSTSANIIIKCKRTNRREENNRIYTRISLFNQNPNIQFIHDNLYEHDRYIRIFKNRVLKYETILSSGIYHILNTRKDFTYIIRVF